MSTTSQAVGLGALPIPRPRITRNGRRSFAYARLNEAFESAKVVPFDNSSHFVFFSDCHRGDNSRADSFARNKEVFLHALTHYYRQGYTYVEVGDGDELWKNQKFRDVRRAHQCVFELLHKFHQQNRLHLVLGNHDLQSRRRRQVDKDGMVAHEGLILRHVKTGQRIFVVHGHQAEFVSDQLNALSQVLVRHVWRPLQILGLVGITSREDNTPKRQRIERRIIEWVADHQMVTVCGHTHHPVCTRNGSAPYFNTGSCVYPGYITGLEFHDGQFTLVKWGGVPARHPGEAFRIERQPMSPSMELRLTD